MIYYARVALGLFITMLSILLVMLPIFLYDCMPSKLYGILMALWFLVVGTSAKRIQSFLERVYPD